LPPEIYWRRRVVAVGLLVLAVLVLFYMLRPLFTGGGAEPTVAATGEPTVSATPSSTPDSAVTRPCKDIDAAIQMSPSPRDFKSPAIPQFTVSFVHTGFTACVITIGDNGGSLHITSGSDRIWDSGDCPTDPVLAPRTFTLKPDDQVDMTATWPRIRSNSSCSANLPAPRAGTYHAVLKAAGLESNDTVFTLSD
jgi:hypothetical protein